MLVQRSIEVKTGINNNAKILDFSNNCHFSIIPYQGLILRFVWCVANIHDLEVTLLVRYVKLPHLRDCDYATQLKM